MKIILAHGVLGFRVLGPLEYFNGVAAHLATLGVKVATAQVNPIGSVAERAATLAEFIVHEAAGERVCVFAHSMGGLDARFALSNNVLDVARHVATLVTIGTPHLGSPVADAIQNGKADVLHVRVELKLNQAALHDLTTAVATKADLAMADVEGINYLAVAGDMTQEGAHSSFAMRTIAALGGLNEPNDGVVTVKSATTRCGKEQPKKQPAIIWPTDHAGEVGWDLDTLQPVRVIGVKNPLADRSHLERYEDLVRRCQ